MMVPATPGSKLKKKIDKRLKELKLNEKVKIIEKPGQKFIQLMKSKVKQPKREQCNEPKCLVGNTEKGGECKTNEVLYEIE